MHEKQVSVIIPIFNSEAYIRTCVNSVLCQNEQNIELILVDDGSTDASYSVCEQLAAEDERIVLLQQENSGVSAARNLGMSVAQGKYITFVDSDDLLLPNALSYIPEATDIAVFDYILCKGRGKRLYVHALNVQPGIVNEAELIRDIVLYDKFKSNWCKLYRAEFLRACDVQFKKNCIQGEDADFNFRILQCKPRIQYINRPVYQYNFNTQTVVNRWKKDPRNMIDSAAIRYTQHLEHIKGISGLDIENLRNDLAIKRIRDLFFHGIDLYCAGVATKENKDTLVALMKELRIPSNLTWKSKLYFRAIRNEQWFVVRCIAFLRDVYRKCFKI